MKERETRINNLEKEYERLKILMAVKELDGKLKDGILRKVSIAEKEDLVSRMSLGLKRDHCLKIKVSGYYRCTFSKSLQV